MTTRRSFIKVVGAAVCSVAAAAFAPGLLSEDFPKRRKRVMLVGEPPKQGMIFMSKCENITKDQMVEAMNRSMRSLEGNLKAMNGCAPAGMERYLTN